MSEIQIITDSTAYLTKEEIEKYHIKVVPLTVNFQGKEFLEGRPGEFEDFFRNLKESKDFPTTSQPSTGEFAKVFKEAIGEGKEVIAILISSNLSGTYNSATLGAEMSDSRKISVIDSKTTVANLKYFVLKAKELSDQGKSKEEIVAHIEEQKKKMGLYLTVDTLEYLRKGGRLSNAGAMVGNLLNIRPIIKVQDGKLESVGKVRGKKKALEMMIQDIPKDAKIISIPHIFNLEEAEEVQKAIQERFPEARVSIEVLGPVIGAHLGPKALGICSLW